MEKQIKMSLETAREMWNNEMRLRDKYNLNCTPMAKWLLENFTKEELEDKKGYTWEESFKPGFVVESHPSKLKVIIEKCVDPVARDHFKNQYATEKQAKSALAFAQLTHIVAKYNEGKNIRRMGCDSLLTVYHVFAYKETGELQFNAVCEGNYPIQFLEFYDHEDAKISIKVNRELWKQYWMID